MVTDFPIQGILDSLVERIVEILPISAAGVTLIEEGLPPRYVAASNPAALRFEQLQSDIREGPCLLAFTTGKAVIVPDIMTDERFPLFAPAAVAAGMAAVFTFPMKHGKDRVGALDLYRDTSGPMGEHDLEAAQTLADVAASYLLNAQSREEAQRISKLLHHSSSHDALTGLPNRALLYECLNRAAMRARRTHTSAAILFADLDNFKQVNDAHGHHVGDQLLIAVAQRLSKLVRPGDCLSRISGDEFVFLCQDLHSEDEAGQVANRITDAFRDPFVVDGKRLAITASVGVGYAGPGEHVSGKLVEDADTSMYEVKREHAELPEGADRRIVSRSESQRREPLDGDLGSAIDDGSMTMSYQPIVRAADGLVTGVEGLLRWAHPVRGAISPLRVVEFAEQAGAINELGACTLDMGMRDRDGWLVAAVPVVGLSVNVSGLELVSSGFCSMVESALKRHAMEPNNLTVELIERATLDDHLRAVSVMLELRALGVQLALDGFGTQFSALTSLRQLPLDLVKLDRALVADLDGTVEGGAIIRSVTELAHELGLVVVATGVEDGGQHKRVRELGCDFAQGFYFAAPMSADVLRGSGVQAVNGSLHLPTA